VKQNVRGPDKRIKSHCQGPTKMTGKMSAKNSAKTEKKGGRHGGSEKLKLRAAAGKRKSNKGMAGVAKKRTWDTKNKTS